MKSAYIITKPIQYLNATNIPDEAKKKDCFIIKKFDKEPEFVLYLQNNNFHWNLIKSYKSRYEALIYIIRHKKKYAYLYLDSDYGIILTLFFFLLKNLNIYVYEEGIGSYRYFIPSVDNKLKNRILSIIRNFIRCRNWLGGNYFTKGVFVYYPQVLMSLVPEAKNKSVKSFKEPLYTHIMKLNELEIFLNGINFEKYKKKNILLYITSWNIRDIQEYLKNYKSYYKILKPHPHITNIPKVTGFDEIIYFIPTEIIISKICSIARKIVILHEDSSSVLYLSELNTYNVEWINISNISNNNFKIIESSIEKQFFLNEKEN